MPVIIRNLLLASLPPKAADDLLPHLTPVEMAFGEVLYEPGQPLREVYFPLEGLVSLLTLVGRLAVEVGMVGREGMVGIPLALGVRREGVTEAAGHLQRDGLIRYSRGQIEVLDRPGLERAACECYAVVKLEFDRLLSDIPRGDPLHVLGAAGPVRTGYHGSSP
jgi:hypothetical protein